MDFYFCSGATSWAVSGAKRAKSFLISGNIREYQNIRSHFGPFWLFWAVLGRFRRFLGCFCPVLPGFAQFRQKRAHFDDFRERPRATEMPTDYFAPRPMRSARNFPVIHQIRGFLCHYGQVLAHTMCGGVDFSVTPYFGRS